MTASRRQRQTFNSKRKLRQHRAPEALRDLANKVGYGGNPEHKRHPGDFNLTPPAQPRADKTLCDAACIFKKSDALDLLKAGIQKGLISEQVVGDYPQNIWCVTPDGSPLEAQLENREQGTYHGYPMPRRDPFRNQILRLWQQ